MGESLPQISQGLVLCSVKPREGLRRTGWNLKEEVKLRVLNAKCPTPTHKSLMNIIIWNCRDALKPSFKKRVNELVQNHNPAILVVMETRVGGDKAKEITDLLLFDGAIHTNIIGYAGGLWVLWNADRVDIALLSSTEQEIHAEVKVHYTNDSWLFFAMYASPKYVERKVLWKKLISVAELYNMSWVIARDFNEPLLS